MGAMKATVLLDGRSYEVVDISAAGLEVECATGFADETLQRLRRGSFEFLLRDPATDNEIELTGALVRTEPPAEGGLVVRIWIAKEEQPGSRPVRTEADPETGKGPQEAFSLDPDRGRAGKTIAVGGGKGGVGKTMVAVNLALALARLPQTVTLLDGDFGNCNCNTLLGITKVEGSLEEYLRQERSLDEITVTTAYPGLRLVCGAQNQVQAFLSVEMPRLLNDIRRVEADCLVIDLGAGVGNETLDLYGLADEKIIVVTPQVTSLQNAYTFIKSAFLHDLKRTAGLAEFLDQAGADPQKLRALIGGLEEESAARQTLAGVLARQRFLLVANLVNDDQDLKIIKNLQKVVGHYLGIDQTILGILPTSEDIRNSVNRITPFVAWSPDLPPSREIKRMAVRLTPGRQKQILDKDKKRYWMVDNDQNARATEVRV
jgi:flagellar biosynthesis protein FlhG